MKGGITDILAIEKHGQMFWARASYEFFQSSCEDIQFALLKFLNVKTLVCNSEHVST